MLHAHKKTRVCYCIALCIFCCFTVNDTLLPTAPDTPSAPARPGFIRRWVKKLLAWLLGLFVGFHLLVLVLLLYWQSQPVHTSAFMLRHNLSTFSRVEQTWVDETQIARTVKQAAIASEDASFSSHDGFDWRGIEAAMKRNERSGSIRMGGSTISQQLAKNLFLFSERSYARKAEEALLTLMIEALWSKERILTVYLNVAEFGHGLYGIEAAAQHYYRKPAARLNAAQAASLIAMLPNPKYYQENRNDRRLRNKTNIILRRMGRAALPPTEATP